MLEDDTAYHTGEDETSETIKRRGQTAAKAVQALPGDLSKVQTYLIRGVWKNHSSGWQQGC
eukprot:6054670-Amphidinium_carterae.1